LIKGYYQDFLIILRFECYQEVGIPDNTLIVVLSGSVSLFQ